MVAGARESQEHFNALWHPRVNFTEKLANGKWRLVQGVVSVLQIA